MNNKNINLIKGSVGLIAIIAAAVLIIGGGAYFVLQKSPAQKAAQVENTVGDIGASVPSLDFSASPLPDLNASSLNVGVPDLQFGGSFSAPSVNTDFSYSPNLDISVPSASSLNINIPAPSIPANIPANIPSSPSAAPSGTGQPSVDCSMFASVPSCSMTGSGEALCKQCFPNK